MLLNICKALGHRGAARFRRWTGRTMALVWLAFAFIAASPGRVTVAGQEPAVPSPQAEEELQRRIAQLIEQLGDDDYFQREAAQRKLAEIGADAFDALLEAAHHEDLEIATRARYLLRLIPAQWNVEGLSEEVSELLDLYATQPPPVRCQVLRMLAHRYGNGGWAALCRLVRFEQDPLWSKRAAVQLIAAEPMDNQGRKQWADTVTENVGRSLRPAAKWLRTELLLRRDRKQAIVRWQQLIQSEQQTSKHQPEQTEPEIIAALYGLLALACAEDGQVDLAKQYVESAEAANPCRTEVQLAMQLEMAYLFQRHGKFAWAERAYRRIIDHGDYAQAVRATRSLAEMFYDLDRPADAAKVLEQTLDVLTKNRVAFPDPAGTTPAMLRARMYYFWACHWKKEGDLVKQQEYLDRAIQADATELDSLIARYHLPNVSGEYRQATLALIEAAANRLRQQTAQVTDEPSPYNQLAWLLGNTSQKLDEALRCAQRAVQLSPSEAAYLDTLAHVHFARGELQQAVQCESRAAELDPHSGFILRELKRFEEALQKAQKPPTAAEQ